MRRLLRSGIAIILSLTIASCSLVGHPSLNGYTVMRAPDREVTYQDLSTATKKEIDCIAENVYYEARGELIEGWQAVASVTLNRARSPKYPNTACAVVSQRAGRVCQFTWKCRSHKPPNRDLYVKAQNLAVRVYMGYLLDNTNGALFFHRAKKSKSTAIQIGQHTFYRRNA